MDFNLSEEQLALQHTARRFVQEQMVKVARDMEVTDSGVPVDVRRRMAEMGFLGINVAEKYGGDDRRFDVRTSGWISADGFKNSCRCAKRQNNP